MPDDMSLVLALPYIQPAQAQKHITHNEAIRALDLLVQLAVTSRSLTTPPAAPPEGARYLVPAAAVAEWAGRGGQIALYEYGQWVFFLPLAGLRAHVLDEGETAVFDGSAWVAPSQKPQQFPTVGINATADSTNRLAVSAPATLFNNAGAGHQVKVNKAAPGDTASLLFQTGFSGRAEMGTAGSDNFGVKVSPDGSTFHEAIRVDSATGRVELPEPVVLPLRSAPPTPPAAGRIHLYARTRAGNSWLDMQTASGRHLALQPHFGLNRVGTWAPASGTTVNNAGMPRTAVGTVSIPTLTATNLSSSMRRWRLTSAATAGAVAEERSSVWMCWRGNAANMGGFTYVNRLSPSVLQSSGTGFFGLIGSVSALSTTLALADVVNAIGIGFQLGTHANWQIVHNDASGAPSTIDLGAGFPVANTSAVITLTICAEADANTVGIRVVEDASGAVADVTISSDLPAKTQFLSPRNYLNNGSVAASVAYECSGVYIETDY